MNYTFDNNGNPYEFNKYYCGGGKHMMITYTDIADIELSSKLGTTTEEPIEKGFWNAFKSAVKKGLDTYSLNITYYTNIRKTETSTKIIAITFSELEKAKAVVEFVKAEIQKEKEKKAKIDAAFERAKKTDIVDMIDENGNITKIWKRELFFGDYVLVADGGNAYHTHADCFESWKPWMIRKFKGWKKIPLKEAEKQGYTLCRFCEKYYDDIDIEDPE